VDWNNDGKLDLITGDYDGHVRVYLNVGTRPAPVFTSYSTVQVAGAEFHTSYYSKPDVVDWNNDGKKDVVVGDGGYGTVHLLLNTGTDASPVFSADTLIQNGAGNLAVGSRASPTVGDFNRDGKKDLVVGETYGQLYYFENKGTDAAPVFNGFEVIQAAGATIDLPYYSRPFLVDWNNDGWLDVLCGYYGGGTDNGVRLYLVNSPDTIPPRVTGTTPATIEAGGASASLITQFQVHFNEELLATDAGAISRYELRRAGPNGVLGDSDDFYHALYPSYTFNASTGASTTTMSPATLPPDVYRFTAKGAGTTALHDKAGNALDGDRNGTGGDNYVRIFEVQRAWTGSAGTWSTAGNWLGGAPQASAQEHLVFANAGCGCTNDLTAGRVFQALSFANPGFTVSGNRVVLNPPQDGVAIDNSFSTSGTTTLQLPLTLGSAATFSVASGPGCLCLDTAATVDTTTTAYPLTLETNGAGTMLVHGTISGGGQVAKVGAGTVVLDGVNTYSGGTNVQGGTLRIASAQAVPPGRALIIGRGAKVVLDRGISLAAGQAQAASVSSLPSGGPDASAPLATVAVAGPALSPENAAICSLPCGPVAATARDVCGPCPVQADATPSPFVGPSAAVSERAAARSKAHDVVLQASCEHQPQQCQTWLWLAEACNQRKPSKRPPAGADAADQVIAGLYAA